MLETVGNLYLTKYFCKLNKYIFLSNMYVQQAFMSPYDLHKQTQPSARNVFLYSNSGCLPPGRIHSDSP